MFLKIFEKFIHGLSFGLGMGISFIIIPKDKKYIDTTTSINSSYDASLSNSALQKDPPMNMSSLLGCN